MGSSSSKPERFPVPSRYDPPSPSPPFKSAKAKWASLSTMKRSKKGKEKVNYEDYIVPKLPTPAAGMYGLPYSYPAFQPAYYAPVQMAVLPMGMQQPFLAMPQQYVQMPTYAPGMPVQPAIVPATAVQPAPAIQMPVAATAPTPAPIPVPAPSAPTSAPTPAPIPVPSYVPSAPPRAAPTQMPQPHPPPPTNQGPVIPRTPISAEPPVIPPPPAIASEPARARFTGFYRPADLPPPPVNEPDPMPEPIRPPTAGPAGRTPFHPTMPIPAPSSTPTPMPMPGATTLGNPLPPPPVDVWDTSPYRQVLANLPTDVTTILDAHSSNVLTTFPEPDQPPSRLAGLFGGSTSRKDKGKGTFKGLFRSRSNTMHNDLGSSSGSRHGHGRAHTLTSIVIPPPANPSTMPIPTQGPPIRFDHTGEFAGFVNHSHHRVMYKNKMYPTAMHLLEAMKFTHRPDLQERIRSCKDVHDMYPLSASFQEHVRPDWGQVFLQIMEDVLYLKFKQHPELRALLLGTGLADIIYKDENTYWGEGLVGNGANELGRALVRVRERLRQEGGR